MSSVREWFESRPDARWVTLFDCVDRFEVATFCHGHSKRRTLKRAPGFDDAMIELVETGLERPHFSGILYVKAWGTRERMHPLYVGKAGRFGRDGESISGNLASIRTNKSKFARWGYGNAYHVGDLSQVLFGWESYKDLSPVYEAWAEKLFESYDPPLLRKQVSVLLIPWYENSIGILGYPCSLEDAKEQLIEQALEEFPDTVLNQRMSGGPGANENTNMAPAVSRRGPRRSLDSAEKPKQSRPLAPGERDQLPVPERDSGRTAEVALILVGCVKTKRDEPAPAKDLYTSDLFTKRRRYAEMHGTPWVVVSAKEPGFIEIDEVLAPYDRVMNKLKKAEREEWVSAAIDAANEILPQFDLAHGARVEVHAGAAYVAAIRRVFDEVRPDINIIAPLEGLKMGEQLRWYLEGDPVDQPEASEINRTRQAPQARSSTQGRKGVVSQIWNRGRERWEAEGQPNGPALRAMRLRLCKELVREGYNSSTVSRQLLEWAATVDA